MSDTDLSSIEGDSSPAPQTQPSQSEQPTSNRYDTMFGSDHESGDESDAASTRKRVPKSPAAAASGDEENEELDDLFGDGDNDEELVPPTTTEKNDLSDADLAESPPPRHHPPTPEPERFVEITLPRHPAPGPGSDKHLYLMKIPSFLSMEPQLFDPEKFTMPNMEPSDTVSAYTKATTAIRYRRDPKNPDNLQSNARIIRWSDGTLSLQIASSSSLYDLPRKDLTTDPSKPDKYLPAQDSHTFVLDPHESAGTLRVVGHATQSLNVVSASVNLASDHAIQRLHSELASAIPMNMRKAPLEISELKDPEAERKEAERIAREKDRANRKLEAQRRRARERDPLETAAKRSYAKVTGTRSKRESPPITRGGRGKEDEYDLEDGFIEGSEEEEEAEVSDEEEKEEELKERPRRKRGESERDRKRRRVVDESDEE
ncbi:Leo1-like protein-domain-containing protein [Sphaerosporella brunnea]|uniref:Leo1-like protein-domain-containing protein n=1 Tax=Sphaerosporella brunnea TaxID=1250544 RepID=A0A5J5F052_9PEZI|nr:Leo1-like protein-domain-containing protein [Sphaerosporella brunnea]